MSIKIREAQAEALARASYRDFRQRLARHLKKFFPSKMAEMKEAEIEAFIDHCIESARKYGLTSEQSVAYFSHLPLLLGEDFETNAGCRFAPAVLRATAGAAEERVKVAMLLAHQLKAKKVVR